MNHTRSNIKMHQSIYICTHKCINAWMNMCVDIFIDTSKYALMDTNTDIHMNFIFIHDLKQN